MVRISVFLRRGLPLPLHPIKNACKSVIRYELGVDIIAGNLVWIQGPYPAGKYNDITIFNQCLRHFLEPGERVEADKGYRGHVDKVKGPGNDVSSKIE